MYKIIYEVFNFLNDTINKYYETPDIVNNLLIFIECVIKIGFSALLLHDFKLNEYNIYYANK